MMKMIVKMRILVLAKMMTMTERSRKEDQRMMYRAEIINVKYVIRHIYHIQHSTLT
jgi:hypothetical protein